MESVKRIEVQLLSQEEESLTQFKNGISYDCKNSYSYLSLFLGDKILWSKVERVKTYQEYLESEKSSDRQWGKSLVEKVILLSNQQKVKKFDEKVADLNMVIGTGLTSEKQAEEIRKICKELDVIVGREI